MSWILNAVVFLASYILMKICSSPNIIAVTKSRRVRCAGCVARMGRSACSIGWGNWRKETNWEA